VFNDIDIDKMVLITDYYDTALSHSVLWCLSRIRLDPDPEILDPVRIRIPAGSRHSGSGRIWIWTASIKFTGYPAGSDLDPVHPY